MLAKHLQALQVIAEDGNTYNLYSGQNPADMMFLDGAGMATVRRINQRTPLQNGVVDKGYRLEPRKMTLGLLLRQETEPLADVMRDKLAYIFGPTNTALQLKATRLDGTVRAIDCFVDGTMDFPQSERVGGSQKVLVPLYAPDPTFYDPTRQAVTRSLSTLPLTGTQILTAGLTADDWPVFEVTGPITNMKITHLPVGDTIDLTGATIPGGETWVFDLRPTYKIVYRQSDNANRINNVTASSIRYFGTLRLLNQKLANSIGYAQIYNQFDVTGSGTTGASSITIRYYKRFLSL